MRLLFTLLRGIGLIALFVGLAGSGSVSAQTSETATLTVLSMSCPAGYDGPDYFETCQSPPIDGNPFTIIGPLEEVERVVDGQFNARGDGRTDSSGEIVFSDLPAGEYELVGGLPGDLGGVASYCYQTGDPSARFPSTTQGTDLSFTAPGPGYFSTFLTFAGGDDITCEIYAIGVEPNPVGATASPAAATPTQSSVSGTNGSNAAIYAGTCDTDDFGDAVAELTDVTTPTGDQAGSADVPDVETSRTTIDSSLDDLLVDDHVLVVFDEDDATVPLACGAIGGTVADDGSLAVALPAVGDSRYAGIATLTPVDDATDVTIVLAENLTVPAA